MLVNTVSRERRGPYGDGRLERHDLTRSGCEHRHRDAVRGPDRVGTQPRVPGP
jgi:hypothetical protein